MRNALWVFPETTTTATLAPVSERLEHCFCNVEYFGAEKANLTCHYTPGVQERKQILQHTQELFILPTCLQQPLTRVCSRDKLAH
jgi:hypothetical protein